MTGRRQQQVQHAVPISNWNLIKWKRDFRKKNDKIPLIIGTFPLQNHQSKRGLWHYASHARCFRLGMALHR